MIFEYEAVTEDGKHIKGKIRASSYDAALIEVYDMDSVDSVVYLKQVSAMEQMDTAIVKLKERLLTRVKLEDLIIFTKQFATMFNAGIDVSTILDRLYNNIQNQKLKYIIRDIKEKVNSGISLSEAFSDYSHIFRPLYVSMIRVGEESGELAPILNRLSKILENELATRRKIKSATRYPKMVISAIAIAFTVIVTFVLPKFIGMFKSFGAKIPLPTLILMKAEFFIVHYWEVMLALGVVGFFAFKRFKSTPFGKSKIDDLSLKLPVVGSLMLKIYISRTLRVLGFLYSSGISITDALNIIEKIIDNSVIRNAVKNIRESVETGSPISQPMRKSGIFPGMVCDMVSVGEETGRLDEMLFKVSEYYDEEVDYAISNLSQAIEPILLIFIAGIVLILALGVFLPMWDMFKVVR